MSWFTENKFLGGVLGVTVIGAGALGYLLFTAKTKYDEASMTFDTQASELNRLEHLPAYPDQQNVKKLEDQRLAHLDLIQTLHKELASAQLAVEPMTPVGFQDRLRASVTEYTDRATKGRVGLPKGFYMGFEPYQTAPPNPEAAPLLGRQLKAVELVMTSLIESQPSELRAFVREPLAEESGSKAKAEPPKASATKAPAKAGAKVEIPQIKTQNLDVVIYGPQTSVPKLMGKLVSNKTQIFIPRYISVRNTVDKGPPKAAAVDPNAPAPAADNAGGTAPAEKPLGILVGEEGVETVLRIEIPEIPAPAPETVPKGKAPAAK